MVLARRKGSLSLCILFKRLCHFPILHGNSSRCKRLDRNGEIPQGICKWLDLIFQILISAVGMESVTCTDDHIHLVHQPAAGIRKRSSAFKSIGKLRDQRLKLL